MSRRIAILFEYPTLNGGERSMLQALDLIDRNEFELLALAPAQGRLASALSERAILHVPFELRDADDVRLPRREACEQLMQTTKPLGVELLHANSLSMGRLIGAVAERLAIPCVAHLRDIMKLSRAAINDLNQNHKLLAVSHATRHFHLSQGLDGERTRVVPNGVDSQTFAPRPATGSLCRELGIAESSFIVLTVGQIGLRKGQNVLLLAAMVAGPHIPDPHFVIVGQRNSEKAESIAFEEKIRSMAAHPIVSGRVHLLGYRDDVPRLMNEAHLLVHPANQEPLGRVLLEAAASGLPIVATDVGGTAEILTDGESARLVPAKDYNAIGGAVVELALDASLRQRLADAARMRILADFTPREAARQLAETWREVL